MTAAPAPSAAPEHDVWKALADPTRRQILDLLRSRPMTTGEIAALFSTSRFAVMKHLTALVEAGLVVVARRGRARWNHLNPVPIQEVYRRWIRPFEAPVADALLRLRRTAMEPFPGENEMPQPAKLTAALTVFEIPIQASAARVWQALTEQTSMWWPADFYSAESVPSTRRFLIEARPGGRMFEDWGNSNGRVWATVITVCAGQLLELQGTLFAGFGGPATLTQSISLTEADGTTTLRFSQSAFGALDDATVASLESGWRVLFGEHLKRHAESGRR